MVTSHPLSMRKVVILRAPLARFFLRRAPSPPALFSATSALSQSLFRHLPRFLQAHIPPPPPRLLQAHTPPPPPPPPRLVSLLGGPFGAWLGREGRALSSGGTGAEQWGGGREGAVQLRGGRWARRGRALRSGGAGAKAPRSWGADTEQGGGRRARRIPHACLWGKDMLIVWPGRQMLGEAPMCARRAAQGAQGECEASAGSATASAGSATA